MAVKGIHERRLQAKKAKDRAERRLRKMWGRDWDDGLTHSEKARAIGTQSKCRKRCSCWMCKSEDYELGRQARRAKADAIDQL